jgi:G:T-mismatch repair DNA endonuclease (very short patch repair protein)
LQHHGVNLLGNYPYKYGEIDIYIPAKEIAVFVDGTIWHGDPQCFKAQEEIMQDNCKGCLGEGSTQQ